jgi:uncharacterized repeat protein (TIGR03803 family)
VLRSFAGGTDGAHPSADLTNLNGTLYGTTDRGGIQSACSSGGRGTVFTYLP